MAEHASNRKLPLELVRQIDTLCAQFESALRAGQRIDPAMLLEQVPLLARGTLVRELLELELEYCPSAEPQDVVAKWRQRFPEYTAAPKAGRKSEVTLGGARNPGAQAETLTPAPPPAHERTTTPSRRGSPPDSDLTLSFVALRSDGQIAGRLDDVNAERLNQYALGTQLQDRYRLDAELGRGGMGVVFLGQDLRLSRPVAVKVMLPAKNSQSQAEQSRLEEMFADEARLGANLTHPAIATVFDYGFHGSLPYTVFEYVPGESLRARVGGGRKWSLDDVLLFLGPVAQGLDFAHGRRVVHRDLKPDNIRVTPQGQFKILDLGLAKEFDRQQEWRFAGTPAYASPEQAADQPCDGRSDQYALALVVYEMLTGRRPFESTNVAALLAMHRQHEPPWPGPIREEVAPRLLARARLRFRGGVTRPKPPDPDIPVYAPLMRALQKDPNRRYSTCEEFAVAMGCQFLSAPALEVPQEAKLWRGNPFTVARVALLSSNDLGLADGAEIIRLPLRAICMEKVTLSGPTILRLEAAISSGPFSRELEFRDPGSCRSFHEQLMAALRRKLDAPAPSDHVEVGSFPPVVLLQQRPQVRYQVLGPLEAQARSRRHAQAVLRLRGAMAGADAIIDVREDRLSRFRSRRLTGIAVRAVDRGERLELRARWLEELSGGLGTFTLILAGWLLFRFVVSWYSSASFLTFFFGILLFFNPPQVRIPHFASLRVVEIAFIAWPVLAALAVRVWKRPQLALSATVAFFIFAAQTVAGFAWLRITPSHYQNFPLSNLPLMRDLLDVIGPFIAIVEGLIDGAQAVFSFFVGWCAWQLHRQYRRLLPDERARPRKLLGIFLTVLMIVWQLSVFAFLLRSTLMFFSALHSRY